jgi:predicted RecA/RadA family phage recombinase
MATNITEYLAAYGRSVTVTHPTTPSSGDPVLWNSITGVAITDEGDGQNDATDTSVLFGDYVATLRVVPFVGAVGARSAADVAVGDAIYYDSTVSASESSALNANSLGIFFGYALSSVASGAGGTGAEISVWHIQ